jgi:hypothetical protein
MLKIITYIHTYHVDLKYVYKHILLFTNHFMKNKIKNLQDIIVVQMYEIVKIQMHFQSNFLIFWFLF